MWETFVIESTGQNIKFGISEHKPVSEISNRGFLELLRDSEEFRSFYNDFLAGCNFKAFFWENKPMTEDTLNHTYECNLINSRFLAERSPDAQTFSRYFSDKKSVVVFPNLGKDARLIVPSPQTEDSVYTHIGSFVRNADKNQVDEFWRITGQETLQSIEGDPLWLSTSGLGVFWLHARIDSVPKYYQTNDYKKI